MLQIGLALSLAVVLGLTQLQVTTDSALEVTLDEQEVVQMEEIQQTKQEVAPPPPPRPPAPVEVPNNAVVEQQDINFDASLDLNESLDVSGPPAPPPPPAPTDDAPAEEEIFVVVEEAPALIGGLAALQQKVRYPVTARRTGIEGRVIVQFIVDESGNVTEPVILRGRHPLLDEEALRVIQQAQFTPGRQRGVAVKVRMSLPIYFKLAKRSN
jgi:protein TonB